MSISLEKHEAFVGKNGAILIIVIVMQQKNRNKKHYLKICSVSPRANLASNRKRMYQLAEL